MEITDLLTLGVEGGVWGMISRFLIKKIQEMRVPSTNGQNRKIKCLNLVTLNMGWLLDIHEELSRSRLKTQVNSYFTETTRSSSAIFFFTLNLMC